MLLLQIAFVVLLLFLGFMAGAGIGSRFIPEGSGLAGPAILLGYGAGGTVLALILGVVLTRRLHARALRQALLLATVVAALAALWIVSRLTVVNAAAASQAAAGADQPERIDYLTFAQGAIPIGIGGAGAALGVSFEKAIRAVDGDPGGFTLSLKPGDAATDTEFIYQLPSPTTFDRFAVPDVLETPSPSATFTREIEVHGSAAGPREGYVLLGSGTLTTHTARGRVTELTVRAKTPVRWVKLRLVGGIQSLRPQMFFEFSEIIGNGSQQVPPLADHFRGVWKGRGVLVQLRQDGPVVSGCYDTDGTLTGTVTGNILRALGTAKSSGVPSAFVLAVAEDGSLRGVRSSNRGPFTLYTGAAAPSGSAPICPPPAPTLGCGSTIHGISFEFDSAVIRPDSAAVLTKLFEGLRTDPSASIVIEGHTSSEGTDDYNLRLSERRAAAVVADLTTRGIAGTRLSAVGAGEKQPIASNGDESGRSLNRRVQVRCR